jgi:hypothetical protein
MIEGTQMKIGATTGKHTELSSTNQKEQKLIRGAPNPLDASREAESGQVEGNGAILWRSFHFNHKTLT